MKFAFFFLAEYTNMIVVSSIATILFFGGWLRPFPNVASLAWLENGWLVLLPLVLGAFAGWLFGLKTGRGLPPMAAGTVLGLAAGIALSVGDLGGLATLRVPVISGAFWFFLKVSLFLFVYIWLRGTYPRYRYDQLMSLGWKWLIPLSVVNVIVTGLGLLVMSGS
jgi:NADH-quinone oxidoreductase subunit H